MATFSGNLMNDIYNIEKYTNIIKEKQCQFINTATKMGVIKIVDLKQNINEKEKNINIIININANSNDNSNRNNNNKN